MTVADLKVILVVDLPMALMDPVVNLLVDLKADTVVAPMASWVVELVDLRVGLVMEVSLVD